MLASHIETLLAGDPHLHDGWELLRLSSINQMATAIESVLSAMLACDYSPKDIFAARLSLEEAICNAIKHGHRHDPTKVLEVRYAIRSDHVLVEVEDEGAGFDPSRVPDATAPANVERPRGRGLLLIRHYAAWVRHNRQGNCITFCICNSVPLPE